MQEPTPPSPTDPPMLALDYDSSGAQSGLTRHELGALALRLVAIYLWAQLLQSSTLLLALTGQGGSNWIANISLGMGVWLLIYGGGGIVLFWFAGRWARFILPGQPDAPVHSAISGPDLQAIAFSVAGVWLVVGAVPILCLAIINHFFKQPLGGWSAAQWPGLWGTILQLVLGIALFLGSRGLSIFWHKLRTGGVQPALEE